MDFEKSGSVEINYKYKKEIITVTGNVVNKIFKVGNAWVKDKKFTFN